MSAGLPDYAGILEGYVEDVLSGATPACRYVRLAAQRHRRDLARAAAGGPYEFDPEQAALMCAFVEDMPHIEGEWAELPDHENFIDLSPAQVFVIGSVNGWRRREDGYRRFRTVYEEVPRKNGKSAKIAGVSHYMLTMDGEPGAKVIIASSKYEQAKELFDVAAAMARKRPEYLREFRLRCEETKIRTLDGTCVMRPVGTRRLDGKNIHFAALDELHEHPNPKVWNSLAHGRSARRQPLMWAITTAGHDVNGVCFDKRDYLIKVLEGFVEDDTWFGAIWTIDEGDDPYSEEAIVKANYNIGVAKSLESTLALAKQAKVSAISRAEYLPKEVNVWEAGGLSAFDMEGWRAAEDPGLRWEELAGAAEDGGATGVDLARTDDFSAVVTEWRRGELVLAWGEFFATQAFVEREGNQFLRQWAEQGLLAVCPGSRMDFKAIRARIDAHLDWLRPPALVFDPHLAAEMIEDYSRERPDVMVVDEPNRTMRQDPPFQELIGLVEERKFVTDGNPVFRWMASNTVIRRSGEFLAPAKLRHQNKIDGIAAAVMATGVLIAPLAPPPPSVYQSRGVLTV